MATPNRKHVGFANIPRALRCYAYRLASKIRVLTASKEEMEETLAFLDSVQEKEVCDAQQYRFYCDIFAGMSIFTHCPETLPDRAAFFEQGEFYLPPDEEDEARRRAESPLDDGAWFPTVADSFEGHHGEKATDEQILRVLYHRSKFGW